MKQLVKQDNGIIAQYKDSFNEKEDELGAVVMKPLVETKHQKADQSRLVLGESTLLCPATVEKR